MPKPGKGFGNGSPRVEDLQRMVPKLTVQALTSSSGQRVFGFAVLSLLQICGVEVYIPALNRGR